MPYPDDELPDTAAPSPFTAQSVYPAQPGATNPELAREYLATHRGDMAARAPEIDNSLSKMQLNVDSMTKMLDDTVASIKAAKSGRSNVPLMAMAAGLLSGTGNFGSQLGAGFGAMAPAIQKQRAEDEGTELNLAQLGMKKAMLQQAPLEAKLQYLKAMQTGDQSAVRAIEQSLIRAQATGTGSGSRADRLALDAQKLAGKTINDALTQARQQVDLMAKEMDWTAEEREAETLRRARQNIKAAKAGGVDIPDAMINGVLGADSGEQSTAPKKLKSYFESPNTAETIERTREAGLPVPPVGYVYDMVGRKERPKVLENETANFRKESKDWDTQSKSSSDILAQLDQAETLLNKNPKLTGPRHIGPIPVPNSWEYNASPDARTLNAIFTATQLHSVPQGQGAVSDMERRLFKDSSTSMDNDVVTNKRLIGLQREIFKRDRDRREFFSEYFNNYKTLDGMVPAWDRYISSPYGTVISRDGAGNPVPNANRMNWREYFRKEREPAGPDAPLKRAKGGAIKLGAEFD